MKSWNRDQDATGNERAGEATGHRHACRLGRGAGLGQAGRAVRARARTASGASPRQRAAGFTLVELLVVIAIIGVLVALLLPAADDAVEAIVDARVATNEAIAQTVVDLLAEADEECFRETGEPTTTLAKLIDFACRDVRLCDLRERLADGMDAGNSFLVTEREGQRAVVATPTAPGLSGRHAIGFFVTSEDDDVCDPDVGGPACARRGSGKDTFVLAVGEGVDPIRSARARLHGAAILAVSRLARLGAEQLTSAEAFVEFFRGELTNGDALRLPPPAELDADGNGLLTLEELFGDGSVRPADPALAGVYAAFLDDVACALELGTGDEDLGAVSVPLDLTDAFFTDGDYLQRLFSYGFLAEAVRGTLPRREGIVLGSRLDRAERAVEQRNERSERALVASFLRTLERFAGERVDFESAESWARYVELVDVTDAELGD